MKKIFSFLTLFLSFLLLTACAQSESTDSRSSKELKVQLIVTVGTNTTDEVVTFEKGDTVMDVLKANYKVKETNGFITSIDGKQQDEKAGLYWMFKVNGKLASKAANQIKAKDGDKIEFYQKVYSDED